MSGSKYEQLIHKIDEKKAALEKLPPDTSDKSFEEWRDETIHLLHQVLRQALPNSNYLGEFEGGARHKSEWVHAATLRARRSQ